jgi:hypothetical protein
MNLKSILVFSITLLFPLHSRADSTKINKWIAAYGNWEVNAESDTHFISLYDCIPEESKWTIYYIVNGMKISGLISFTAAFNLNDCWENKSAGLMLRLNDSLVFFILHYSPSSGTHLKLLISNYHHDVPRTVKSIHLPQKVKFSGVWNNLSIQLEKEKLVFKINDKEIGSFPGLINKNSNLIFGVCTKTGSILFNNIKIKTRKRSHEVNDFSKAEIKLLHFERLWKNKSFDRPF